MDLSRTIAQIATAPGNGAIAIIRISGSSALSIANSIFSKDVLSFSSHTAHLGKILSTKNMPIDEVVLLPMKAPHSFTGEDVVEIHCHGGLFVTKKILNRVFEAGAEPAGPGEFTYRAFQNNKIDLTKAEAIQRIISAKNEEALSSAEKQLEGALFEKIDFYQKELLEITAIIEASIDFPEEDLEFSTHEVLEKRLQELIFKMQNLENTFHLGKIYHEGLSLCLCGPVNVGKSSLLNALLQKDRAIVTDIAGTTRDVLEEELHLKNFHLKAIDTAGIRDTDNIVEKEGIKRSKIAIKEADIVLCVLDAEMGYTQESKEILNTIPKDKSIVVWNKTDLKKVEDFSSSSPTVYISVKEKKGISELIDIIEKYILGSNIEKDEVILSEQRHKNALHQAIKYCSLAKHALNKKESPEFISSDLQEALRKLASIIGIDVTEDLLDSIFSQFCLGK